VALNVKVKIAEVGVALAVAFTAYEFRDIATFIVFLGLTVLFSLERLKEEEDKKIT
jgi:hypothetical protein